MARMRISLKVALIEIGAVLLGAIGVVALLWRRTAEPATLPLALAERSVGPTTSAPTHARPDPHAHHAPAAPETRPGWQPIEHAALPRPTYWPAVMALGIIFIAWGIITTWIVSAVGLAVFAVALAGWIGELRHDH